MKEVLQIIENYIEDRPRMKENNANPKNMERLLREEVEEFVADLDTGSDNLGREAADIVWFVASICFLKGIDLEEEIREKAARNHLKRPAVLYSNGLTYEQAEQEVKKQWTKEDEKEFYA